MGPGSTPGMVNNIACLLAAFVFSGESVFAKKSRGCATNAVKEFEANAALVTIATSFVRPSIPSNFSSTNYARYTMILVA